MKSSIPPARAEMPVTSWWQLLRSRVKGFWFEPIAPTTLGVFRLMFFVGMIVRHIPSQFPGWAYAPKGFWMPLPVFQLLHLGFPQHGPVMAITIVWWIAMGLSALGLFTRASTVTAALLGFYLLGLPNNFGKVGHGDPVGVLFMFVLAFSYCGDAMSFDSLIRTARNKSEARVRARRADGEYAWPVRLVAVLLVSTYFAAGVAKLRHGHGWTWVASDSLTYYLLRTPLTNWVPTYWGYWLGGLTWITKPLAALTLALELTCILAPFSRVVRRTILPGLFMLQGGIFVFMGILFTPQLSGFVCWLDWEAVGVRVRRWIAARPKYAAKYAVLNDGSCGLCQDTVRVLQRVDVLGRVEYINVVDEWPTVAARWPQLSQARCLEDMHVVAPNGRVYVGFDGYRALAHAIPLGWLALPFAYLPPVPTMGRRVYRRVAQNRLSGACAVPALAGVDADVAVLPNASETVETLAC